MWCTQAQASEARLQEENSKLNYRIKFLCNNLEEAMQSGGGAAASTAAGTGAGAGAGADGGVPLGHTAYSWTCGIVEEGGTWVPGTGMVNTGSK